MYNIWNKRRLFVTCCLILTAFLVYYIIAYNAIPTDLDTHNVIQSLPGLTLRQYADSDGKNQIVSRPKWGRWESQAGHVVGVIISVARLVDFLADIGQMKQVPGNTGCNNLSADRDSHLPHYHNPSLQGLSSDDTLSFNSASQSAKNRTATREFVSSRQLWKSSRPSGGQSSSSSSRFVHLPSSSKSSTSSLSFLPPLSGSPSPPSLITGRKPILSSVFWNLSSPLSAAAAAAAAAAASIPASFETPRTQSKQFAKSRNDFAKHTSSSYLRLLNTLHGELGAGPVPETFKYTLEDLIRSGNGLEPYTTERGESAWLENGIVYRPWRIPDRNTMHKDYPSPFFAQYEPYIPFHERTFFEGRTPYPSYRLDKKIILWYTPSRPTQPEVGLRHLKACPDFPCYITTNKAFKEFSSAMVFAAQILESSPPKRRPDQIFVLHNDEPPYSHLKFLNQSFGGLSQPGWRQAFNWTMTYRMDSDFVMPYGIVRKRPKSFDNKDYQSIVRKKTKMAAWIVSHCRTSSKRENYVRELQKYIDVYVYGNCGTMKCEHMFDFQCAKHVSTNYKFYLSFENAFCPDYITEKFFHYLTMDTISVVRGTDQYYVHAPQEIFLNTADFPSAQKLAEKMLQLHHNDTAYIEMLKEKDKYMSIVEGYPIREADGFIHFMGYGFQSVPFCNTCQRLWNLDKYAKTIPDIKQWFDKKRCTSPKDMTF